MKKRKPLIIVLIVFLCLFGLIKYSTIKTSGIYSKETAVWKAQASEKAVNYVREKYGKEAKIKSIKPLTNERYMQFIPRVHGDFAV